MTMPDIGMLALARTLPTSTSVAVPVLLLGAAAVLTGLVFFPQERFRIPVIDPTLIVCAAAALTLERLAAGLLPVARVVLGEDDRAVDEILKKLKADAATITAEDWPVR